jgi:hypothetical protein
MRSALAGVLFVACTSAPVPPVDAGLPDAGPPDAGSPDAGVSCSAAAVTDAGCAACQADRCCVTLSNCSANTECAPLWACMAGCTTSTCKSNCYAQHPAATWAFSGLAICSRNACATECGLATPSCGGIGLTTTACDNCVMGNCCTERTACATTDQCDAFIYQCLDQNQCPDAVGACAMDCRVRYDGGLGAFDVLRQCALDKCPVDCAGL